jgi:hypothetical protein
VCSAGVTNHFITLVVAIGSTATAASCATTVQHLGEEAEFALRLAPATFGKQAAYAQRLTVLSDPKLPSIEAYLEVDQQHLQLAFLAAGRTAGTLSWNGTALQSHTSIPIPDALSADRILTDVQLVWWPTEVIASALGRQGFELRLGENQRTVVKNGRPLVIANFEYTGTTTLVTLDHLNRYRLSIESVPQ